MGQLKVYVHQAGVGGQVTNHMFGQSWPVIVIDNEEEDVEGIQIWIGAS